MMEFFRTEHHMTEFARSLFFFFHILSRMVSFKLNPLSTKGDQHEISPYNINAFEHILVMRIEYIIREDNAS